MTTPTEPSTKTQTGHQTNLLLPEQSRWAHDQGPVMVLEDVHKSFGKEHVLRGIDLEIQPGEITVIVGASGSGKSVLIKLLNGLIRADSGRVSIFGQDPKALGDVEVDALRKRMGTLFQNYALFDSMTVLENVAFPLIEHKATDVERAEKLAKDLVVDLELEHALALYPSSLSGGMKKRIALARTMITNPELVLFDEPTTGLDPIMMEFVDDMIRRFNHDFGLTSVIISHDMASTFRLADSIAVLHEGKIIAHDSAERIKKSDDERVRRLIFASDKTSIDMGDGDPQKAADPERDVAVVVKGLRKAFDGREVLKGIDLTAPKHAITVLIGGSGSGKSVLMKHILGLFKPTSGSVNVLGLDVPNLSEDELAALRSRIGMLFQHAALFDSMTVLENVMFPLRERRKSTPEKEARALALDVLEKLKLTDLIDRYPTSISNGQQKRVSLARALVTKPDMMIYDEPTTGQDPIMCDYVEGMIVDAQEQFELTSLIISHDMASTFRIGDHVAMLYHGEIIAQGQPRSLLESQDPRVQEFVFAADVADDARHDHVE